jgi:hypothetical protein
MEIVAGNPDIINNLPGTLSVINPNGSIWNNRKTRLFSSGPSPNVSDGVV